MTPQDALRLLKSEIVQVVGCTEPAAIGYAFRTLVRQLPAIPSPDTIYAKLHISQDAFRNASTAVVPRLKMKGVLAAASAGLASRVDNFNVFSNFDLKLARSFLKKEKWLRIIPVRRRGLFVHAEFPRHHTVVTLAGRHDHIEKLVVFGKDRTPIFKPLPPPPSLDEIFTLAQARNARIEALALDFIMRQVPAEKGYRLEEQIARRIIGRMSGFSHPVMTLTGSGNQGIFIGMTYRKLYAEQGDAILPAVVFSLLAQILLCHKYKRLSSTCGLANKAAPALAAGLAFSRGASTTEIQKIIRDVTVHLSGIKCEGAEPACGEKARQALHLFLFNSR